MTDQGNGHRFRYRVVVTGEARTVLVRLNLQSRQEGRGEEFLAALRKTGERLRDDPLNFGEPQYRLPALHLVICQAIVARLVVDFAVHEDRPLVFIHGFKLLSGG